MQRRQNAETQKTKLDELEIFIMAAPTR